MSCTHESIQNHTIVDSNKNETGAKDLSDFQFPAFHNVNNSNTLPRYPFVALIQLSNNLFWWILPQFDNN